MGAYSSKHHQEIEPKVGGGPIFRSGPSFIKVQYNSIAHILLHEAV